MITAMLALALIVSGCGAPAGTVDKTAAGNATGSSLQGPAELFKPGEYSWYAYNLTESFPQGSGRAAYVAESQVKVWTADETLNGAPVNHKIISLGDSYSTIFNYYDLYVDAGDKVLGGNFTVAYNGHAEKSGVIAGSDYLEGTSYVDIAAALQGPENLPLAYAGCETVAYGGMHYNCSVYNITADDTKYTVWYSPALPLPVKIVADRAGASKTYELAGWGSGEKPEMRVSSPVPTPAPTATPAPAIHRPRPGPSKLFRLDGISWYQYVVAVPLNDSVRHKKVKVEYSAPTQLHQGPDGTMVQDTGKVITITDNWYAEGYFGGVSISENEWGEVTGGSTSGRDLNRMTFGALGLSPDMAKEFINRDLSRQFNAETDRTMQFQGYENVSYGGDLYNCSVYGVNGTYTVWSNASLPLPLKIVVDAHDYPEVFYEFPTPHQVVGPSTYELLDWG